MNYKDCLQWMFSQLPMYQRQGKTAFKKDLTNSFALSKHLGFPEKKFKTIHVAGTNGKGSTSHMIASVLQEAGYKVGLYTSPHLNDFRERIKVNGEVIKESEVVDFIKNNKIFLSVNKLSFFEMTVGMALDCFARHHVDIAIVEVGLGGRLDSTNIISPEVSVITNIGLDHTQFLGNSLIEIAQEKGGIIKKGIPVVIGEYQPEIFTVFEKIAKSKEASICLGSTLKEVFPTDLKGSYQVQNSKTAVRTIQEIRKKGFVVSEKHIKEGLLGVVGNTGLLGRWQTLQEQPKVICDTGHNKEGLEFVFKQLLALSYKKLHIVLGVVDDKDLHTILPLFPKKASYYFCRPAVQRGLNENELREKCSQYQLIGKSYESVGLALSSAKKMAHKEDLIFVGGSTFVVAEVL